jgi:RNA polymerase sigma factor (sigma-70 family)
MQKNGGVNMDKNEFENLLLSCKSSVERMVYYKMPSKTDGDDVLQEVYLSAFNNISSLKDSNRFKFWILKIANNKCNDFYRKRAKQLEISIDELDTSVLWHGFTGISVKEVVNETLDGLKDNERKILYLYYIKNKPQADIAKHLGIPIGTVKSRLYTAKQSFKKAYPYPPIILKGESNMKTLPNLIPNYKIIKSDKEPFELKYEELMGWFIIPRLNENCSWAMYDYPSKKKAESYELSVQGKATVHGIEGVEILSKESLTDGRKGSEVIFIAQLSENYNRFLAESHFNGDTKYYYTFLDEDEFLPNWGIGENNCGSEVNIKRKGNVSLKDNNIISPNVNSMIDVLGRYTVDINDKVYDAILVINIENQGDEKKVMTETYLDKNGRTVLWRRFNHEDWSLSHFKQKWTEKLPNNDRININNETYVHWYDCITDYIL